ncbi:hypothetical protein ACM64Y_01690 [Novispirillum sp. DQ9]|uniref:hypothetical protein n=1 Tax=Novispirillum sp. DQ9 TaxID=3398612 RepID=UPI003C7A1396
MSASIIPFPSRPCMGTMFIRTTVANGRTVYVEWSAPGHPPTVEPYRTGADAHARLVDLDVMATGFGWDVMMAGGDGPFLLCE